ncbi:glycosyltransferase family 2 protein [Rugosimonospora africana]|uniref:Glycosyl transferase n=1 Tax=Rugosimonospora africana TaxID=556532 RepID=A0A8J3VQ10_9ACTN|nr:glycosyltransferase family 2 protein [Rugosimonospora africana]GIH14664.1 glycosyl transferase [Rugosimonospora africana]
MSRFAARVPGLFRRHRVLAVLLVLGLALRVLAMIAVRPAIFYIDSVASYLLPLPQLAVTGQDPIGYDILILKPVLAVANLTTVVALQHLMGLGIAITGYALLVHKGAWRWLAALAMAPVLLDAYQVQIEHNIMSDPLFEALLTAALTVLAWPRRPDWRHVLAAGLLLGIAVPVRQAGEPLIIAGVVYVLLAARAWRWRVALTAILVGCFALPIAGYAVLYHHSTGVYGLSRVGGGSMYGRVATFADCTGVSMPDDERALCPPVPRPPGHGPDYWAHDPASPSNTVKPPAGMTEDEFLRDFDKRILKHQPLDFAGAVLRDSVNLFGWGRPANTNPDATTERWRFQTTFPTFLPLVSIPEITQLSHRYGDGPPTVNKPIAGFLRGYQLSVGFTPGPVVLVSILIALAAALGLGRARRAPTRGPAALFLITGVVLLLFSDLFQFSWRYQLPGYILFPIAAVLGLVALFYEPPRPEFPEPADVDAERAFTAEYGERVFPSVVMLIAAYNEEKGIGAVLDSIPKQSCGLSIAPLVVVDGCKDGTAAVAREHGAYVCDVPVNRGQGAALRLGYHLARTGGAEFIVTTDADGQYEIAELPLLLKPLLADEADFVTGSRQLGSNESADQVRRLGTKVFAGIVSVLTRQRITDTSFGFRAMRAELTGQVRLTQPQYQSSELLVGALCLGYRVREQPMTMHPRNQGSSKKGNNLVYGSRYARVVFSTWLRERKMTRSRTANLTRNIAA